MNFPGSALCSVPVLEWENYSGKTKSSATGLFVWNHKAGEPKRSSNENAFLFDHKQTFMKKKNRHFIPLLNEAGPGV